MSSGETIAVLGFRPHTYWTAAVALSGPPEAPQVLERRRITFATGDERLVFHQAAEAGAAAAGPLIDRVRRATQANAIGEIATLLADLQGGGVVVRAAVVPAGKSGAPMLLEEILTSHTRIHAAEGNFYRDVVAAACETTGLAVRRLGERELPALVGRMLGAADLAARLKAMGAALGPPWSEDQKLATLAAWAVLGEPG